MHWDHGWHMGGMWIWWLLAIVLVGLVVWLVARGALSAGRSRDSAEEVLRRRLAAGEIDQEEYDQKLRQLRK